MKVMKVFSGVVIMLILVVAFLMHAVAGVFNNASMKSIRAVREMEELRDIQFYYPDDEELRIELVYEAGRRILPWNRQDSSLLNRLPVVLVSERPVEELLPSAWREQVQLRLVDVYDNNRRPQTDKKRYSSKFIRRVTIIEKKHLDE